jgi:heterodisulfide reductase subunit B
MKYLYYPGCSQKATAKGYEDSLHAVLPDLGLELQEMEDWNCCGSTPILSTNKVLALALSARNMALAEKTGLDLVTHCPSCWLSLYRINKVLHDGGPYADKIRESLAAAGLTYSGKTKVLHLLDLFVNVLGVDKIKAKASTPLTGLKVAPYYGCQIVRPYAEGDSADNPQNMEKIITAIGATPVEFAYKTTCCGATLVATREKVGSQMSADILRSIKAAGADVVVTPCSLCQVTLEAAGLKSKKMLGEKYRIPILTLTQLMGLAMGKSVKQLGINRQLFSPRSSIGRLERRPAA